MRIQRILPAFLAMALLAPFARQADSQDARDVQVKPVNYGELCKIVKQFKGKVVVVDFWAPTCVPCVREFPKFVKMQEKYAAEGFAAVSVDVAMTAEEVGNPQVHDKVKAFLLKQKATSTNLILEEKPEVWQKKLDTDGVPCVFVFDREGKIAQKYGDGVDYAEIEKVVVKLLSSNVGTAPASRDVQLKAVKYDGMSKIVNQLRGKVVVVDMWNYY